MEAPRPRPRTPRRAPPGWLLALAAACSAPQAAAPTAPASAASEGPYVLVLGTAQDGGLPQIGCRAEHCERARAERSHRRLVTSLLIADPQSGKRWLIDATPDLREQVELARGHPPARPESGPRPALFEAVFLTHAHMGHYSGLLQLGREAYAAAGLAVFASRSMQGFLERNGPWSLMVETGQIALLALEPDLPVPLASGLRVTPVAVPHRGEFTDTLAFLVEGPTSALLYLPDIDKWERWERPIEDLIAGVDVALIDGTFFGDGEVPGRSLEDIPHPFIAESLARFAALAPAERAKIHFTHLNHTNPAAAPGSPEARSIRAAGMQVAREGQRIDL